MLSKERKQALEKQHYRIVGNHSSVKICLWTKNSIRNEGTCYKNKFYGIKSWRCVQMSPVLDVCTLHCEWCWRDLNYNSDTFQEKADDPSYIIDKSIEAQKKLLEGFYGNSAVNKQRLDESMKPIHFAISLTAEPTFYPKLPELVDELHKRNMTSFIVTNGTNPQMLKKLIKHKPTQLYITLPAPDEETFNKFCRPNSKDDWKKIKKSLSLLGEFERGTIRLTLAKEINLKNAKAYANILKNVNFKFLEAKAAMPVGHAKDRLKYSQMPTHKEIKSFAAQIAKYANLKIIDEHTRSRVVLLMRKDSILLMRKDSKDRFLKF